MISPKLLDFSCQTCKIRTEIRPWSRQMPQSMKMDAKKLHCTRCQSFLTTARELPVAGTAE
jgi:hypothetical protein